LCSQNAYYKGNPGNNKITPFQGTFNGYLLGKETPIVILLFDANKKLSNDFSSVLVLFLDQ